MKKIAVILIILLSLTLWADPPSWEQISGTQFSMVVMAQINFSGDNFSPGNGNIVAAFGPGGETDCRAIGSWQTPNPPLEHFWYFTVVANDAAEDITFKIYDGDSDTVFDCATTIVFINDNTIGSPTEPFQISTEIGTLSGTVTLLPEGDPTLVTVTAGGYSANPDASGNYSMQMAPGSYTVNASLAGYAEASANIQVQIGQTTTQNFNLLQLADYSLSLPPTYEAPSEDTFTLPITLSNVDSAELEGLDIILNYDQTMLNAEGATINGGILDGMNYGMLVNTATAGEISIVIYANGTLSSTSGTIAFVEFTVLPDVNVGTSSDIIFTEANVNEVPVENNGCTFTVSEVLFDLSGNITYYSNGAVVEDVLLNLNGESNLTTESNQFGDYYFNQIFTGYYTTTPSKTDDLGGLSGTDASRVARFSAGLYSFNGHEQIAADATLNGEISALDASRIARYATGLITDMNSGTDWVFTPEAITDWSSWPPIEYNSVRTYSPLTADLSEEDFIAIRLGDVTGNWDRNVSRPMDMMDEPTASLPELIANPTTAIQIPVTVNNLSELEGMDITIAYNQAIIEVTSVSFEGGILEDEDYALQFNTEIEGQCTVVLYAVSDLFSGSGIVMQLEATISGSSGDASALSFLQFEVNETSYMANVSNGSITIEITDSEEDQINSAKLSLKNYPNPFNPTTVISFVLNTDSTENTEVVIYNSKGQKVNTLPVSSNSNESEKQVIWSGDDFNGNPVSSGIYFYRLNLGNQTIATKKMLLMK